MSLFIADVNAGWIEGFLLTSWISNVNWERYVGCEACQDGGRALLKVTRLALFFLWYPKKNIRHMRPCITLLPTRSPTSWRATRLPARCDPGLLKVPSMNLSTMGERAFSCTAPKLWNSLPNDIRQCESTAQFKKELKTSSD